VVVFAVGVGTETGAEIQVVNEQGQRDFVRDSRGQPVRSRLDEASLRKIAEVTKGGYYPLGQLGEGLTKIRLVVASAEFTSGPAPVRRLGVDRFHIPVAIVLGLLVVESLMGTRRRVHA
jgi:Ca-activated chloride channel family protein